MRLFSSERIDGIALHAGPHERSKGRPVGDVHAGGEQVFDELNDADIGEEVDRRLGIEFDEDVDVAVRLRFAPCGRAEQGGADHTVAAQVGRVVAQAGEDLVTVHGGEHSATVAGVKLNGASLFTFAHGVKLHARGFAVWSRPPQDQGSGRRRWRSRRRRTLARRGYR